MGNGEPTQNGGICEPSARTLGRLAQQTAAEPHGAPRELKKVRLRTQIRLFVRVSRILVFSFSPLLPLPIPDVATNGRAIETTDILVVER